MNIYIDTNALYKFVSITITIYSKNIKYYNDNR